jgi:hypothetical protein
VEVPGIRPVRRAALLAPLGKRVRKVNLLRRCHLLHHLNS